MTSWTNRSMSWSASDLAGVTLGPYGSRRIVVTSGDRKERTEVVISRTDLAILSDLITRREVVAAWPVLTEAEVFGRLA
jgi:hypothetical protein